MDQDPRLVEHQQRQSHREASTQKVATQNVGPTYKYNPDFIKLASFYGIDSNTSADINEKLLYMGRWAEDQNKTDDVYAMIDRLENIRKELGLNLTGKSLVNEIYKRLKLRVDRENEYKAVKDAQSAQEEASRKRLEQERNKRRKELEDKKEKLKESRRKASEQKKIDKAVEKAINKYKQDNAKPEPEPIEQKPIVQPSGPPPMRFFIKQ